MVQKKKKTKSHGKPSINQEDYRNTMDNLGIDITYGDMRRPKPIAVYTIYCIYKKVLDQQKYTWSRKEIYCEDHYDSLETVIKVIEKLEKQYPRWYFSFSHTFVKPEEANIISKSNLPKHVLVDLNELEEKIIKHFNKDKVDRTAAHKKKILEEIGADENETIEKPKKKSKKK